MDIPTYTCTADTPCPSDVPANPVGYKWEHPDAEINDFIDSDAVLAYECPHCSRSIFIYLDDRPTEVFIQGKRT